MQKKLLALAVAGVLAAPAVAMAQSAVTISGIFKVGIDNLSISNPAPARAGLNTSENRVTDNSSRLIFGVTEDIGGGLSGIAQVDMRYLADTGAGHQGLLASGNTWVGLRSTGWGTVTLGRHELHYGRQPDDIASKAGALMASSISLMDNTANGAAIAVGRTSNVVRYDSPNWSGFAFTAAYSANPGASSQEGDLSTGMRKGNAWNFNPSYTASNFAVGWSHWNQKADAGGPQSDIKSNVFYGYYLISGFKVGLAVNSSKVESNAGVKFADRRNWTIPVSYTTGPHNIYAHYTKAGKDKVIGDGSDAKMMALAYVYDLSKRTSLGLTYAKVDNNSAAKYNFFTNTPTAYGSLNSGLNNGEDARLLALTVRHAF